jgi:hypothetical protein
LSGGLGEAQKVEVAVLLKLLERAVERGQVVAVKDLCCQPAAQRIEAAELKEFLKRARQQWEYWNNIVSTLRLLPAAEHIKS